MVQTDVQPGRGGDLEHDCTQALGKQWRGVSLVKKAIRNFENPQASATLCKHSAGTSH